MIQTVAVGEATIYAKRFDDQRLAYHDGIVYNVPTGPAWGDNGDNGTNIRILTVYITEGVHRVTGWGILKIYKYIDAGAIFLSLMLLLLLLHNMYPIGISVIAVLYIAAILPLTYSYHVFHPYDRTGLLLWVIFAFTVRYDRHLLAVAVVLIAVLNKYDAVVLPGLYLLAQVSRNRLGTVVIRTGVMFALTFGLYFLLRALLPGGFAERDLAATVMRNTGMLVLMNVQYPPLLAFGLPIGFSIYGWRVGDQFSRAGFVTALAILLGPLFLATNFHEVRAEMGPLVLMLPLAVAGLSRAIGSHAEDEGGAPRLT